MATRSQTPALASEVRITVMRLARRLRSQRALTGLSIGYIAALGWIDRNKPITARDLAAHEKVTPPSMTKIISTLEDHGLITREPHPSDGRQVLLRVSKQGKAMLAEDRRARDAWLAQRLAALTDDEQQILHEASLLMERLAGS